MYIKRYVGYPVRFRTKCINPDGATFLRRKWYDVLDTTPTTALIQFNSGGAKWYSKSRFRGIYY